MANIPYYLQYLVLIADIQAAGRLVKQEHFWLLGKRPRQHHLLPFSSAELIQETSLYISHQVQPLHNLVHNSVIRLREPPAHVGLTSQHYHIMYRHLCARDILRNKCNPFRHLQNGHGQKILSIQHHFPRIRRKDMIETFEQRTFSHTVIAQDSKEFSPIHLKADILKRIRITPVMITDFFHTYHSRLPSLNRRYRNKGPPRNEVIAPIGRMTGLMTTLANKSLSSRIVAPVKMDPGMTYI